MSQDDKELLNRVDLGIETEAFLNSRIGQYLVAGLEKREEEAVEKLKTADPNNIAEIVRLQLTCENSGEITSLLGGLIEEGWQAERLLKGEES